MDYFQGVVTEYLRASRSVFVNTEYLLQLDPGDVYIKNRHWYCDAVALDNAMGKVQLCEVTFSQTLHALVQRLKAWNSHWPAVVVAIHRDSALRGEWQVEPRVFIPQAKISLLAAKMALIPQSEMPAPVVTALEEVVPWKYRSWNGKRYEEQFDV